MSGPEILSVDPVAPDEHVLSRAAGILRSGGVVVYPTETLYGVGADALSEAAVEKVLAVKRRGDGKPILVVVDDRESVEALVEGIPPAASVLMQAFWPGPLTLVFRARAGLPAPLTQGTGTIGIRIPSGQVALRLAALAGVPVTSTSANRSGEPVPVTAEGIRDALDRGVDLILDGGILPPSAPSTVVDVSAGIPRVLREGAVPLARLERIVPCLPRSPE